MPFGESDVSLRNVDSADLAVRKHREIIAYILEIGQNGRALTFFTPHHFEVKVQEFVRQWRKDTARGTSERFRTLEHKIQRKEQKLNSLVAFIHPRITTHNDKLLRTKALDRYAKTFNELSALHIRETALLIQRMECESIDQSVVNHHASPLRRLYSQSVRIDREIEERRVRIRKLRITSKTRVGDRARHESPGNSTVSWKRSIKPNVSVRRGPNETGVHQRESPLGQDAKQGSMQTESKSKTLPRAQLVRIYNEFAKFYLSKIREFEKTYGTTYGARKYADEETGAAIELKYKIRLLLRNIREAMNRK